MQLWHSIAALGLLSTVASHPSSNFQERCAKLANNIDIDYAYTVNIAEYLEPDAKIDYKSEGVNATCLDPFYEAAPVPVGVCRLNLRVETTESSELYMEVWLPENWTGRVLMTGNGGLAGCISYGELAYGASYGFATFGTNAGHNGTSGGAFFHQPEVLEDFSWRAVYTGATIGKSITKEFYKQNYGKSYYIGCSTGGRQGWKAVQNNPELFDGVLTGAPAFAFYSQVAWFGLAFLQLGFSANETIINIEQWGAVQAEVYKQCDSLDGAQDNILENPAACKLDWTPLLCADNSNSSTCLTSTQVEAAAKLFAPISYNGTFLHPGHLHGSEVPIMSILYAPMIPDWITDIYRYVLYEDESWDPRTFTLADAFAAIQTNPANLNTYDADISAFRDRGGKVLHWHGGADFLLDMGVSDIYYSKVQSALNASVAELDEFYRYFRAPGVYHCYGGPGANFMGQLGKLAASDHPDDNMLMRIVEWVEKGEAPEFVRGTKFVNDTVELGVEFTRKHCKYPKINVYTGEGNGTDEAGWECVEQ